MKSKKVWIDEIHKDTRYGIQGEILVKHKSAFQEIIIIKTKNYGNALMLDGCWMTSDKEEKYYHECLVHPALSSIERPSRTLIIGGGDGGTARECLKYSEVSRIDLVEIDKDVIDFSKQYLNEIGETAWKDKRLKIHILDGIDWVQNINDNYYDAILIDCSDPAQISNGLFSLEFYQECKRILKRNGVFGTQSESPESFKDIHLDIIKNINDVFNISSTFYSCVPIYPSGIWSWTFASDKSKNFLKKQYKDIELIEKSCDIWNLNYQSGGFKMMPNKIFKELAK